MNASYATCYPSDLTPKKGSHEVSKFSPSMANNDVVTVTTVVHIKVFNIMIALKAQVIFITKVFSSLACLFVFMLALKLKCDSEFV